MPIVHEDVIVWNLTEVDIDLENDSSPEPRAVFRTHEATCSDSIRTYIFTRVVGLQKTSHTNEYIPLECARSWSLHFRGTEGASD